MEDYFIRMEYCRQFNRNKHMHMYIHTNTTFMRMTRSEYRYKNIPPNKRSIVSNLPTENLNEILSYIYLYAYIHIYVYIYICI